MRGGAVPKEVMESFAKLLAIANENNVSFEEICMYALGQASDQKPAQAPIDSSTATTAAAHVPKPFQNEVHVLLDAEALRQCFDTDFNFLLVVMEGKGQVWQIGLVVRAEKTGELKTKVERREIGRREVGLYGIIEFEFSKLEGEHEVSEGDLQGYREKFVAKNCQPLHSEGKI